MFIEPFTLLPMLGSSGKSVYSAATQRDNKENFWWASRRRRNEADLVFLRRKEH